MPILFPCKLEPNTRGVYNYLVTFAASRQEEVTLLYTYDDYYLRRVFGTSKIKKYAWNKMLVYAREHEKQVPNHVILKLRSGYLDDQVKYNLQKDAFSILAVGPEKFQELIKPASDLVYKGLKKNNYQILCLPDPDIKYAVPKNILVIGSSLTHAETEEQQQILSLGIQKEANIHYLDGQIDGEQWSYESKPLTSTQMLFEKTFPHEAYEQVLDQYIKDKKIDFIAVCQKGIDAFTDWINRKADKNIKMPVLFLKFDQKQKAKSRFDSILSRLPKTKA